MPESEDFPQIDTLESIGCSFSNILLNKYSQNSRKILLSLKQSLIYIIWSNEQTKTHENGIKGRELRYFCILRSENVLQNSYFIINTEMKLIILALLLVLTFQLHPSSYVFPSPIEDLQFSTTANSLNQSSINNLRLALTETRITFRGCKQNWALFHTGNNGFFEVEPLTWKSTHKKCRNSNDQKLIQLINQVTNYEYDGFILKLKNDDGTVLIQLTQH